MKITTETTNTNSMTFLQPRLSNETVVNENDDSETKTRVTKSFLGKLNQVIQPKDQEKGKMIKDSNNVESIGMLIRASRSPGFTHHV